MVVVGLCRFSLVGRGDWKVYRDKTDEEILPIALKQAEQLFQPERIEARLKTFEHLTLASMRAQTDEDFHFIVLASEMMPQQYREKLEEICSGIPQVTLRFFGMLDAASAQKQVYRELKLSLSETIQFRLDDDDCVCADFVEQLKAHAEPLLESEEPFAISLSSTLYCALTDGKPETYHWPIKFFSAGAALKHDRKSIFGFGHFALERRFRSSIIPDRMSLATHNGNNDTEFTAEIAHQRGCVRLTDEEIADRLVINFPFLTMQARALVGLPNSLQSQQVPRQQHPPRAPAPSWLNSLAVSKYRRGFYVSGDTFAVQHTHRKSSVLYVGFDDLSRARDKNRLRDPWGYEFAEKRDWSSLGVMAYRPDWFRSDELFGYLDRLRGDGLFEGYRKVVFSGVSMGGICGMRIFFSRSWQHGHSLFSSVKFGPFGRKLGREISKRTTLKLVRTLFGCGRRIT
ncbi:glycosyltransferase [Paracoccus onubensis]|uniref:glycosyltransferase n=1 Tax=Paracoccus onubensis TaxID=1675788 RepID=UPI0027320F77|nr:glycosyltransferase [Paracoccus onubensis]MDP0929619.1 glycosyltransferase [Paracoccus onubensis]